MIRLLLADDHTIITDGINNLLSDAADITVEAICQNGQEVLDKIKDNTYDILLLDIDMPVMNGLECAENVWQIIQIRN